MLRPGSAIKRKIKAPPASVAQKQVIISININRKNSSCPM